MSDHNDAPVSDAADDSGSSTMKWLGPIIALLFCAAILAGIGVANAASYDGELPHHDDPHGEEHSDDDDDHGDEADGHDEDGDDEDHE